MGLNMSELPWKNLETRVFWSPFHAIVLLLIVIFYLLQDWHICIDKYTDGGMHRWLDRSYMCISG